MQKTESASFDLGEDDADFDSEMPTGEARVERSELRSLEPEEMAGEAEDKKVAPQRALEQAPLAAMPPRNIAVGGMAPPKPAQDQPVRPGTAGPLSTTPPAKAQPEPMAPTQPAPRLRKHSLLANHPKTGLALVIGIWLAIIAALAWWLFG